MQDKMNDSPRVWKLKTPMTFTRPRFWNVHLRYALLTGGEEIRLNTDTWLLELGPNQETISTPGQEPRLEYLYRLANGETVALDHTLTMDEAQPEDHPQVIAAMIAFRTLDQAILEEWGLHVEHIDSTPPFGTIRCPICGFFEFVSIDFAEVYCLSCNSSFSVRHTAGDPGFVVEARPKYAWLGAARYLIPRTGNLVLQLVYKNGLDPRQKPTGKDLPPERLAQTDETHPSLRPGLYTYNIGDLYEWRLGGLVPTLQELDQDSGSGYTWNIEGEWWPLSAHIRVSGLTDHHQAVLVRHLNLLQAEETKDETLIGVLTDLVQRLPNRRIGVHFSSEGLPPLKDLAENQRYLLREWLICTTGKSPYTLTAAYPVWYVVEPILSQEADPAGHRRIEGWEVVRRNICPVCHQKVISQEMVLHAEAAHQRLPVNENHDWYLPHGRCREVWEKGKWLLYQWAGNAIWDLPMEEPVELQERYWLVLQTDFRDKETEEGHCPLFAIVYLSPELVRGLFWWSQVAQSNQRSISCIGTDHGLRLPAYFSVENPGWKDCFTGLTLAEQNGYVVLNNYPLASDDEKRSPLEEVATRYPWIAYFKTGEFGWSTQLEGTGGQQGGKAIETVAFPHEALKRVAELMGIIRDWEEKHRRVVEAMARKADSQPNKK